MVPILMMSSKLATLGFLKIKVCRNKVYYVIISAYDVTNQVLSSESSYIVDVVNFGNSSVSIREFIITSIL